MTQEQLENLLGRPLTPIESENFDLYLDIAIDSLEDLICTPTADVTEERTFDTREGYSTVFVDIFRSINTISRNGVAIDADDYSIRQWNKRNGSWYNSIVLERPECKDDELVIDAVWGFGEGSDFWDMPNDLQYLLAGLFDLISKKNAYDGTIQSKQVEDFRITFNTNADIDEQFSKKYSSTISKYSLCAIGNIKHGRVC